MSQLPVALQLYTVRDLAKEDMAGTLRQVAEMGYQGVELAGYGNLNREQLKAVIDETALTVVAAHSSLERLMNELDDVAAEADYLGFRHVILTWMPEDHRGSADNWKLSAQILNDIGAELQRRNLQLCFHNHSIEFEEKYDGQYGLDILYANSDPQLVQAELDTYWIKKGGLDPTAYIKKYAGRVPLLHIKDRNANGDFAEIGAGLLNWPEIYRLM
jgi:sugar phosphate isomerase/epimerase